MELKEILKHCHKYAAEYTEEAAMENNQTPEEYEETMIKEWALIMVGEDESIHPTSLRNLLRKDIRERIESH